MKRLKVNSEVCSGCRICELACSMGQEGVFDPKKGLIRVEMNRLPDVSTPISQIDVPKVCLQCDPAPCAESCPSIAFTRNKDLEISKIDRELCTACGICADECQYKMIKMNEKGAMKCDLCNGDPVCVRYCPTGAISFS